MSTEGSFKVWPKVIISILFRRRVWQLSQPPTALPPPGLPPPNRTVTEENSRRARAELEALTRRAQQGEPAPQQQPQEEWDEIITVKNTYAQLQIKSL